jgi:hypothetical protein
MEPFPLLVMGKGFEMEYCPIYCRKEEILMIFKELLLYHEKSLIGLIEWQKKCEDIIKRLFSIAGSPPTLINIRDVEAIDEETLDGCTA